MFPGVAHDLRIRDNGPEQRYVPRDLEPRECPKHRNPDGRKRIRARVGLIGDYNEQSKAHHAISKALQTASEGNVEPVWIPTDSVVGPQVLSGRSVQELAFLAGRHLTYYRPGHYPIVFFPTLADWLHAHAITH